MEILAIHRVQLPYPPALQPQMRHFYGELLQLPLMPYPAGPLLRYGARGQRVDLVPAQPPAAAPAELSFEVEGLPHLRKRLLDAGLSLEEHQALPGYLRFYVRDPAGHRLEFVEPDDGST